jgi:c-di-GMP-binding flagellar brake protein YcgR
MWKKRQAKVTRPRSIEERQKVTLRIDGHRGAEARVEEVGDTYAILGLFMEPDQPLARMGTVTATLEAVSKRGKVRIVATARQHNDEPDAVRIDFDRGPEKIQRRESFRLEAMADVVLSRRSGAQVETHTLDLSASGVLLPGPPDLRMDEQVWVAIDVGEDTPVRARGRVVRITDKNQKGVLFDHIDEKARERLIRYLFARQRQAARVERR